MRTSEVLRQARKLIEKPESWTQRVRARDANGFETGALAPTAAAWCSDGALGAVCCRDEQKTWFEIGYRQNFTQTRPERSRFSISIFFIDFAKDLSCFPEYFERES
jgi:hypothetical protein